MSKYNISLSSIVDSITRSVNKSQLNSRNNEKFILDIEEIDVEVDLEVQIDGEKINWSKEELSFTTIKRFQPLRSDLEKDTVKKPLNSNDRYSRVSLRIRYAQK